jgi:hypothetical protein
MRKSAILAFLLLALALPGCELPPEVSTALSEPDPALLDKRLSGVWYTFGPTGYVRQDFVFLEIVPRADRAGFDVIGLMMSRAGPKSVQWLRATAYASEIDGEIYYNVKRLAWVGDDYTAEGSNSYLILKPVIAADSSLLFLHSMDAYHLKELAKEGTVKSEEIHAWREPESSYVTYDLSRDDLIRLIRDTAHDELFSWITGPFYRIGPDFHSLGAVSSANSSDAVAKFGTWQVDCNVADTSDSHRACRVHDEGDNVVMWFSRYEHKVKLGKGRCDTSRVIAQVDDTTPMEGTEIWAGPRIDDLIERMHLGQVLRLEYRDCVSEETKRAEIPIDGFAAIFATAKRLTYQVGGK